MLIGTGVGAWLGGGLSELYMLYYRFPFLRFGVAPGTVAVAALVSAASAVWTLAITKGLSARCWNATVTRSWPILKATVLPFDTTAQI